MGKRISFFIIGFFAILIGLYPLMYFFVDRSFGLLSSKPEVLLSSTMWNVAFYTHIILGGIGLLIGWLQFHKRLRRKRIKLHRNIGKVYVIVVAFSAVAGIYIGIYANGGMIAKSGFVLLGIVWFYTTISAYLTIRKGEVNVHQRMMIYSYAACFAAVTLRIWLPLLQGIFGDFITAFRIVAWLCWVPNLIVAYFIIKNLTIKKEPVLS